MRDLKNFTIIVMLEYLVFYFVYLLCYLSYVALLLIKNVCYNVLQQLCSVWLVGYLVSLYIFECTCSHVSEMF